MGINFDAHSGEPQDVPGVFHEIGYSSDNHTTTSNNWEWVTGVTMTAVRPNSTYHITGAGHVSHSENQTPSIRVRRGNTNTYVGSNSNGIEGRAGQSGKYDSRLFTFTEKDNPGLRTGDTVTYSLQIKTSGSAAYMGASGVAVNDGASLNVVEIGPRIGETDPDILGRDN